jgi:predicted NBD/HSP70 family sugar kinase
MNSASVLRLLLDEGPLARVDIATKLSLTSGAVTRITADLATRGLVRELDPVATSDAGRRRVPVDIAAGAFLVAGVHIGLELTTFGLVDLRGRLVGEPNTRRHGPIGVSGAIDEAKHATKALLDACPTHSQVIGAGVISGGFILRRPSGPPITDGWQIVADHNSLGWHSESLAGLAPALAPVETFVDNAYRAHSKAELMFGAARGAVNFIEIFVGSLTGAAFVLDGAIYSGQDARAPDITHLPVSTKGGIPCDCGRRGCLRSVAGAEALVARAHEEGLDVATITDISHLARDGNEIARALIKSRTEYLGEAVAILIDLLAPEKVVLAGAIHTLDNAVDLVRSVVAQRSGNGRRIDDIVVPTTLGEPASANIVAAAAGCLVDVYDNGLVHSPTSNGDHL